ncbi:hypothetical protein [Sporichthya polymorpha]|uniref:hypothetical protein n=1 Tax=Sporichthya polymorpha TaxID=35751 RepID=UPI0012EC31FE|nr:hypothetical protein [Sporichthya polymorpha]
MDPGARALLGDRPRRGLSAVIALTGSTLVAVLALGLILRAAWPGNDDAPAAAPAVAEPMPSTTPAPRIPAAGEPLLLPQPTGTMDGVAIGFPATAAGAVAAAYAYTRIATGLDAAATLRALEQVAEPRAGWLAQQRTAIADGVAAQRASLGLAPVGPSESATLTLTPAGYQFEGKPGTTTATVLTLAVLSGTAVDGTRTTGPIVFRWDLRWDGERWRAIRPHVDEAVADLAAVPLTSEAAAKGWREARGG